MSWRVEASHPSHVPPGLMPYFLPRRQPRPHLPDIPGPGQCKSFLALLRAATRKSEQQVNTTLRIPIPRLSGLVDPSPSPSRNQSLIFSIFPPRRSGYYHAISIQEVPLSVSCKKKKINLISYFFYSLQERHFLIPDDGREKWGVF